jgi:hypothetical protein
VGAGRANRGVYGSVEYDAVEVANSTPLLFVANFLAQLYQHRNRDRLACTGGSDAHILTVIGSSRTYFPGETADDLRIAIEERITRVSRPGYSPARQAHYIRNVPDIRARDRERKAREVEAGIREPKPEKHEANPEKRATKVATRQARTGKRATKAAKRQAKTGKRKPKAAKRDR